MDMECIAGNWPRIILGINDTEFLYWKDNENDVHNTLNDVLVHK